MLHLQSVLFGFVGGLLLNVMPCVLPVLSLKVAHTLELHRHGKGMRASAVLYALGVVAALLVMATTVLALRFAGTSLGWGMQFQYPGFVATLTVLVWMFALNALGLFSFQLSWSGKPFHETAWGTMASGAFAAVMSTPCTAPFLGTAAGFALDASTPPWVMMLIFASVGLGLAFPFLLIAFIPGLANVLPKPGAWMHRVKQVMGVCLLLTAAWLYSVLYQQVTHRSAVMFVGVIVLLTLVLAWPHHLKFWTLSPRLRRAVVLACAVVVWGEIMTLEGAPSLVSHGTGLDWTALTDESLQQALSAGRPVFIDFTAAWCASCKVNEAAVLDTQPVRDAMKQSGVVPMKADMTNPVPAYDARLASLGRSGIPTYVIYFPDGSRDLWPVVITVDSAVKRLRDAGNKIHR